MPIRSTSLFLGQIKLIKSSLRLCKEWHTLISTRSVLCVRKCPTPQECRSTDASHQRDGRRRGRAPPVRRLHQSWRGRRRNRPSPAGRRPCSISPGCSSVHLIYGMQLEVSSAKVQTLVLWFPTSCLAKCFSSCGCMTACCIITWYFETFLLLQPSFLPFFFSVKSQH